MLRIFLFYFCNHAAGKFYCCNIKIWFANRDPWKSKAFGTNISSFSSHFFFNRFQYDGNIFSFYGAWNFYCFWIFYWRSFIYVKLDFPFFSGFFWSFFAWISSSVVFPSLFFLFLFFFSIIFSSHKHHLI